MNTQRQFTGTRYDFSMDDWSINNRQTKTKYHFINKWQLRLHIEKIGRTSTRTLDRSKKELIRFMLQYALTIVSTLIKYLFSLIGNSLTIKSQGTCSKKCLSRYVYLLGRKPNYRAKYSAKYLIQSPDHQETTHPQPLYNIN